ncbi:MAG: thioredoxin [Nitrososphaerota archaeon]|nr:thioredoxin [Nitrososphaerota archaeon]MDG6922385.1 thioredoxin [Nitrososphaerota archaeon]
MSIKTVEGTDNNWQQEVERANVPVVVDFWAPWCGPCRMVSPTIEKLAQKFGDKLKVVKVNVDDNQALAMKYNIMSIPTIVVFKDGKALDQAIGAAPSEFYEKMLQRNHII